MNTHGHVTPRPDGVKARCGGPAMCAVCQREQAALSSGRAVSAVPWLTDARIIELADQHNVNSFYYSPGNVVAFARSLLSASPTQPASAPAREGAQEGLSEWAPGPDGTPEDMGAPRKPSLQQAAHAAADRLEAAMRHYHSGTDSDDELSVEEALDDLHEAIRKLATPAAPAQPRDERQRELAKLREWRDHITVGDDLKVLDEINAILAAHDGATEQPRNTPTTS